MTSKVSQFKSLFDITSPFDLKERSNLCDLLHESLENQKMKTLHKVEESYNFALHELENQFKGFKANITAAISKEQKKIQALKDILILLGEMKTLGITIEQVNKLKENKVYTLIAALSGVNDFATGELKKLAGKNFEFSVKVDAPKALWNLSLAMLETITQVMKGRPESDELDEKKLSRFGLPTSRWGIFEARNQIEAVSFSVNKTIFMTGIGVGNAFHQDKTVKVEKFYVLKGPSTSSEVVLEGGNVELKNDGNSQKVKKICFDSPAQILENEDYTIKLVVRGGAGVFRGGTTTRIRESAGVVFKFKPTIYSGDDVKNGENADDGPIFDIFFKFAIDDQTSITISRFDIGNEEQDLKPGVYNCILSFNRPLTLSSFSFPSPSKDQSTFSLTYLRLSTLKSEVITSSADLLPSELKISFNPSQKKFSVPLENPILVDPSCSYLLELSCSCTNIFKPVKFKGKTLALNGIIFKTKKFDSPNTFDMSEDGPLIDLQVKFSDTSGLAKINIPPKFLENVSGEVKIERFETYEKQWHLGSENQVECFAFSFSEDVILTALGLGNCAKVNSFVVVESLQILAGSSSAGQVVYNSIHRVTLYNSNDESPVVKTRLESPVRIIANASYTIRVVMRGEGKAFKGKKFVGSSINTSQKIVFKCFKAKLMGSDKQNGDNESSGPIFDIYFIPLLKPVTVDDYSEFIKQLYPKNNTVDQEVKINLNEMKVTRYNNVGSSWHVNTDGKQIEAISFKTSENVKLTAVGIGNAHEERQKVTVSKIQIKEGKSTRGTNKIYKHKKKEKLMNVGEESKFVRVELESPVPLKSDTWYTLMLKYKPGVPVCRGTMANNQPSSNRVSFTFEKTKYEGTDVENGSHEVHGPLRDFYFTLT
jgi:hypothetical protein